MIAYHKCSTFKVLEATIHLYSEELEYGYSTVAEVDNQIHYLGNELPNITTAIFAWEYIFNRLLTKEELRRVLNEHNIL